MFYGQGFMATDLANKLIIICKAVFNDEYANSSCRELRSELMFLNCITCSVCSRLVAHFKSLEVSNYRAMLENTLRDSCFLQLVAYTAVCNVSKFFTKSDRLKLCFIKLLSCFVVVAVTSI